jgi:hypothetical protein
VYIAKEEGAEGAHGVQKQRLLDVVLSPGKHLLQSSYTPLQTTGLSMFFLAW